VYNLCEDYDDVKETYGTISSLDDLSLCGDSTKNYVVKFTFNAYNYNERGRNKIPFYDPMMF
jgi:hypothetical protein